MLLDASLFFLNLDAEPSESEPHSVSRALLVAISGM